MNAGGISIIIPARNAGKTIERTLRSLFDSSSSPDEVILVDDGCTDDTLAIAGRYPCKVIRSSSPGGVAAARNSGAKVAGGDVFLFVDADVVLLPDALETAASAMKDPTISVAVGLQSPESVFPNPASIYKNLWLHFTYKIKADSVSVIYSSAVAIRREAFEKVGGFDTNYQKPNIEDSDLGKRISESGFRIVVVPEFEFFHIKSYSVSSMVRTDFLRTVGMTKVQIRDRFRRIYRENYTSIPTSFLLSCVLPWATIPIGLRMGAVVPITLSLLFAMLLNIRWLLFLVRREGVLFLFPACLFLLLDIITVNLGLLWGVFDYLRGKTY